jgi:hypothetical protein
MSRETAGELSKLYNRVKQHDVQAWPGIYGELRSKWPEVFLANRVDMIKFTEESAKDCMAFLFDKAPEKEAVSA